MYRLAGPATLGGEQMALRDVLDIDQVEARVDIGGHPVLKEIQDDSPGRSRLQVERADRRGRIDDHDPQALARGGQRGLLGHELAALVRADHVCERDRTVFASRPLSGDAERADGAGVDHQLGAGAARGFEHVARAVEIGGVHRRFIEHPEPVVRGEMVNFGASMRGALDRGGVAHVADRALAIEALQRAEVGTVAHQHADAIAAREQSAHDMASDKAVASGYECGFVGHGESGTILPPRPHPRAAR